MDALELNYEIEYGNKLIADFMGWQHHEDEAYDKYEMSNLKYHNSWNWIMPVVLKLHDKGCDVNIGYRNTKIEWMDSYNSYETKSGVKAESKIQSIWCAIIHFLEWVRDEQVDLDNPEYEE